MDTTYDFLDPTHTYEKECLDCGQPFTTEHDNYAYCPECYQIWRIAQQFHWVERGIHVVQDVLKEGE